MYPCVAGVMVMQALLPSGLCALLVLRERLGAQFSVLSGAGCDAGYYAPCCEGLRHRLRQAVQGCLLVVATSTRTAWCIKVLIVEHMTKHWARPIGHVTSHPNTVQSSSNLSR